MAVVVAVVVAVVLAVAADFAVVVVDFVVALVQAEYCIEVQATFEAVRRGCFDLEDV